MKMFAASVLLMLATTVPGFGQAAAEDTVQRIITIPAPENGVIYIRSGKPGGVRIRSLRRSSRSRAAEVQPSAVDVERLNRVLDRQGFGLDAEAVRFGDRVLVVLRDAASGAPADTLSAAEVRQLTESLAPADEETSAEVRQLTDDETSAEDQQRTDASVADSMLIARIERSLLDLGIFRSLQVHFAFDRSNLLPSSRPTLDAVVDVMTRYPDLQIEIAGHTDAIGTTDYNEALSARRAASVKSYLVDRGIDRERLTAVGYGENRPILSNDTATGRALNRRVEFRVLDPTGVQD